MRHFPVSTIAIIVSCLPALAGETPWQPVAPDVAIRLISAGQVGANGKALVALEIDMPETTKTYWRIPGEAGLPIDLDFSASQGVAGHQIFWPYPLREKKSGLLDYVYYGRTVLPIEIDVADRNGTIDIAATLGICSDICVPARAQFSLPIVDGKPDMPNGLRIRQALAEVPIGWTERTDPIGAVSLMPGGRGIGVSLSGDTVAPESVIAATANGDPLFGAPQKSPHGNLVVLPILGKSDNIALDGMDVEVTFMTDMGAYVVSRTIETGASAARAALGQ